MSTSTNGGTAFPKASDQTRGMWLRDYMAGQALSGIVADSSVTISGKSEAATIAKMCYLLADAMIAERSKQSEDEGTIQEYLDSTQ